MMFLLYYLTFYYSNEEFMDNSLIYQLTGMHSFILDMNNNLIDVLNKQFEIKSDKKENNVINEINENQDNQKEKEENINDNMIDNKNDESKDESFELEENKDIERMFKDFISCPKSKFFIYFSSISFFLYNFIDALLIAFGVFKDKYG